MTVRIWYLPMAFDDYVMRAKEVGAMTVEEVVRIVNQMPPNADEWTTTLNNGDILTLRTRKPEPTKR